jgi:hypothetical protein
MIGLTPFGKKMDKRHSSTGTSLKCILGISSVVNIMKSLKIYGSNSCILVAHGSAMHGSLSSFDFFSCGMTLYLSRVCVVFFELKSYCIQYVYILCIKTPLVTKDCLNNPKRKLS